MRQAAWLLASGLVLLAITTGTMTLVMHLERPHAAARTCVTRATETDIRVFSGQSPQDPHPHETRKI